MTIGSSSINVIISITLSIAISSYVKGQDIEGMSLKNAVKVSGGVGFQTTAYKAFGVPANRDPFLWQLNLNLNLNLFGVISAPFSATISSQQSQLSTPQPFNNFGISPKYKAFTAHLGYRSINLSEFTLSGSQFLGVGLEVAPKESFINGKALWGRFAQPVYFNPDGTIASTPSFARFGWGGSLTFGKTSKHEVTVNLFKAKDDRKSLDLPEEALEIKPADNLAFGISTKQQITERINVEGEIDFSLYTNDSRIPEQVGNGYSYLNNLFLLNTNSTTEVKKAIVMSANYAPDFAKFSLKFRRVDPGYKTLGAAFINSDYEDLSLKTSFTFFDKKMAVSVSGGGQRNNINEDKITQTLRLIGTLAVNYKVNDKWNTSATLSNFSTNTKQSIIVDIDSLRFVQTTKAVGANVSRTTVSSTKTISMTAAFNYQEALEQEIKLSEFYNANIGTQIQFLKSKLASGASIVMMQTVSGGNVNANIGPSLNLSKQMLKGKLQSSFAATYLNSFVNGASSGEIMNFALNGNYTMWKKHKIGFNASTILKKIDGQDDATEITATFKYGYSF